MIHLYYKINGVIIFPLVLVYYLFLPKRIKHIIKEDYEKWCAWKKLYPSLLNFSILFVELREFRSVVYLRLKWRKLFVFWLWKPQDHCYFACNDIGSGLIVQHGYNTIVVAEKIGKNFHVNQCVNIVWNGNRRCSIGDNVSVFAGAIIVGGVNIGNNVIIGAGAVVVKDVPDNSTVIGNPMRIIAK